MKKLLLLAAVAAILVSCGGSKRSFNSTRDGSDNSLQVQKTAHSANVYKIIPEQNRITYTINDRKKLKGLSLNAAKEKVLSEAVMHHNCALIVEPNYSFDLKGKKKVVRITVAGYPANYNFDEVN